MKPKLFFILIICLLTSLNVLAQTIVSIVDAKQEWQSTGITINSGESFTITGRGTYADGSGGAGGNPSAWATADGRGNGDMAGITGLLAPNFSFASLIGKIGNNGVPFGIGSYILKTATTGGELYLSINDKAGTFGDNYGYVVAIISANTVTDINQDGELIGNPSKFKLEQNYPNPFNPSTNINIQITEPTIVELTIYNINGEKIKELISNELYPAGNHTMVWDGTDNSSKYVSSGIYFYQLKSNNILLTKKMILLR